jgi:hypothetical protein
MSTDPSVASGFPVDHLRSYVQVFDAALPAPFCAQMIASFEQMSDHHVVRKPGWREGLNASAWTELDLSMLADNAFKGFFYKQVEDYLAIYNQRLGLTIPVPPSPQISEMRIKRYVVGTGEAFQPHFDAIYEVAHRYLVFLWYLNDVEEGGETEFCDLGIRVAARAGRLLMFPPYWMFQHAGLPPVSNDKYFLSLYLLFPQARLAAAP